MPSQTGQLTTHLIAVLNALYQRTNKHKIIIYDFDAKHPLYFIEWDGSTWQVHGTCDGCPRDCCDIYPPSWPELNDGHGGCKAYIHETRNGIPIGRCDRHHNKPLGCALYPCNDPKNLGPHRATWDAKNCQYKLVKLHDA